MKEKHQASASDKKKDTPSRGHVDTVPDAVVEQRPKHEGTAEDATAMKVEPSDNGDTRSVAVIEKEIVESLTKPDKKYHDLWALVIFYLHLLVVEGFFIRGVISVEDWTVNFGDLKYWEFFGISFASCIILLAAFCTSYMYFMNKYPKRIIFSSYMTTMLIITCISIYLITRGLVLPGCGGMLTVVVCTFFIYWWRHKISYSALLLETCVGLLRKYKSAFFVSLIGSFVILLYALCWLTATFQIFAIWKFSALWTSIIIIVLVFCLLWTVQVVFNCVHTIISGIMVAFYFSHGATLKPTEKPKNPVLKALHRAMTTNLGSICFGSMFTAFIQLLNGLLNYRRSTDRATDFLGCNSRWSIGAFIGKWVHRMAQLFNKYVFVMISIYGRSFFPSAKLTMKLVKRKGVSAIANESILNFVFSVAALTCGALCTAMVYTIQLLAVYPITDNFVSLMLVMAFLVGVFGVSCMTSSISSAAAALFVCYIEDPAILEKNNPILYARFEKATKKKKKENAIAKGDAVDVSAAV